MKLTKFDHSTFYLEKDGHGLLFDPVEYNTKLPDFTNLDAIIITHKHGDHFQPAILERIRQNNSNAKIFTTADNSEAISDSVTATPSQHFEVGNFVLDFFGTNQHSPIYSQEIPCENLCVTVDGCLVNPGDSFDLSPIKEVKVLLVPISAPWLKTNESVRFIEQVHPKIAVNTHDALLSEIGLSITNNWLAQKSEAIGTQYKFLRPGDSIEF